jgi:uncharacterized protein (TIGR04255 family)
MASPEHERLAHAPIVEAVFELRTGPQPSFSLLPGKVADALSETYPTVRETELTKVLGIVHLPDPAGLIVSHQFFAPDEKQFVQLSPWGIAVNTTSYPGYAAFRSAIDFVLERYFELAEVGTVKHLGLRYINGLPRNADLTLSYTADIELPLVGGIRPQSIAARAQYAFHDPEGTLAIALASPHPIGASLDLDFYRVPGEAMDRMAILAWLDAAHDRVYEAFRAMVPPALFNSWK